MTDGTITHSCGVKTWLAPSHSLPDPKEEFQDFAEDGRARTITSRTALLQVKDFPEAL